MNNIDKKLREIKKRKRIGLMTHVVIGYPSIATTISLVKDMASSGVDFVELQIPFSDPLADGSTIMHACEVSLKNGTRVKDAFTTMKKLSREIAVPLLFMVYYNTVFAYGVEKFCHDAMLAGASGLIVPDMPIDEENKEHFYALCKKYNLYAIHVVSPASTESRLAKNGKHASGFVYATARQGITGAKNSLDPQLFSFIQQLKKHFSIPLAVGFGISKKEHIQALQGKVDIAVIGSAILDLVENGESVQDFLRSLNVKEFAQDTN